MNICLKGKGIKKRKRKRKRKKKNPSLSAGSDPAQASPYPVRRIPLPPLTAHAAHPPSRHALPSPAGRLAPPVSHTRPLSLAPALPLAGGPQSSVTSPSPVIGHRRDRRWPPPAPSPRHYSLTSKIWRLASPCTVTG
jgi:hypothetical protein